MVFLISVVLFLLGLLAAQGWVVAKVGGMKSFIDQLQPLRRYLGIAGLIIGAFMVIDALKAFGYFSLVPMHALLTILTCLLLLMLGLLEGYDPLQQYVFSKSDGATRAGASLRGKIAGMQVQLGMAAMVVAILDLLF